MGLLRNPLKSFIISAWLHPNVAFPGNVPLSNLVYGSCQCVLLDKMMHCMSSERRMSLSVTKLGSPAGAAAEGNTGDAGQAGSQRSFSGSVAVAATGSHRFKAIGLVSRGVNGLQQGAGCHRACVEVEY